MNERQIIEATSGSVVTASLGGELLSVDELMVGFDTPRGVVRSVNGITFDLQRGKTIGIVGESGSGKSVTAKAIMGLLPTRRLERSGRIVYEGRDISDLSQSGYQELWGTEMAMVFQDPMTSLNPVMKIGRQVTESLRVNLGMDRSDAKETAIQLLSAVRLPAPEKRFDEYPGQLSGGMRQRVVIAVALACGPKLLFADEPTTALDVTVQAQILDLLQEQQRDRFMGMVLVTHDLGVVAGRADDIAVMYAGRIVEKAPAASLFNNMQMPYTEALLNSIPKLEYASHTRLEAIAGRPPDLVDLPKGCAFAARCRYATAECVEERPPLEEHPTSPGHYFACFHPIGSAGSANPSPPVPPATPPAWTPTPPVTSSDAPPGPPPDAPTEAPAATRDAPNEGEG
jgi:oligopeptide/dipeptide ABC transporter ATP-binding protein